MQQQPSLAGVRGGEGGHSVPHCRTQFDVKCDPTILVATSHGRSATVGGTRSR